MSADKWTISGKPLIDEITEQYSDRIVRLREIEQELQKTSQKSKQGKETVLRLRKEAAGIINTLQQAQGQYIYDNLQKIDEGSYYSGNRRRFLPGSVRSPQLPPIQGRPPQRSQLGVPQRSQLGTSQQSEDLGAELAKTFSKVLESYGFRPPRTDVTKQIQKSDIIPQSTISRIYPVESNNKEYSKQVKKLEKEKKQIADLDRPRVLKG